VRLTSQTSTTASAAHPSADCHERDGRVHLAPQSTPFPRETDAEGYQLDAAPMPTG